MPQADYIAVPDLADELRVQKQWLFKIIRKLNIETTDQRQEERGGQRTARVSPADAMQIREYVATSHAKRKGAPNTPASDIGHFYVVQLEPTLDPGRYKVGFATDPKQRLLKHKTSAPHARLYKTWTCHRTWERAAIAAITKGVVPVREEVFSAVPPDSLAKVVERGDAFFALMPQP